MSDKGRESGGAARGFTPDTLNAVDQLKSAAIFETSSGPYGLEVKPADDTLWVVIRRRGQGAIAMRAIPPCGPAELISQEPRKAGRAFSARTPSGVFDVAVEILPNDVFHISTALTPSVDLLVPFWPRDLYPLDNADDPRGARGRVEAAQRGLNVGLCYFCVSEPAFGAVLYLQDFSTLNPYFAAAKTTPDGVVGGEWPELGYKAPTSPLGPSPPVNPLRSGERIVIGDAYIALKPDCPSGEIASAEAFLDMLAAIYPHLAKPGVEEHEWLARAERTLADLDRSPKATVSCYGHRYIHPYTASEYPDCMVQIAITRAIFAFARAFDRTEPLSDEFFAGMEKFFDEELGALRRYLPNVGEDKNRNAVDSWYLYHPLLNLGRMALQRHEGAADLFKRCLPYATMAARHFRYKWPIQFDIRDFSVLEAARDDEGFGQTDVGGLYAYVMLLAFDLTGERSYVDEAKAALRALEGVRFELVYQTNLTAWGATACLKLWKLEGDDRYRRQSAVFTAGFFHNCSIWDSQIANAAHFANFFGVTCLHDAPYMAAYECYESSDSFAEFLEIGGDALSPAERLLIGEFIRYGFDRGWYFYPDALPEDALAKEDIRNGHIDRSLSFPLEDLYNDGQPAGQVGQEIYGCGGAFVFATLLADRLRR